MVQGYPYQAGYAKSGRATCIGCDSLIEDGKLRIAQNCDSAYHDGTNPEWYHFECFFRMLRPNSESEIDGFSKLRSEDQKKIKKELGGPMGVIAPEDEGNKHGKNAQKAHKKLLHDFEIQYSVSGRAKCAECLQNIPKEDIRVKKVVRHTPIGMKFGGQSLWRHLDCFVKSRDKVGWYDSAEKLPGFKKLSKEDQGSVKKQLPAVKMSGSAKAKKATVSTEATKQPKTKQKRVRNSNKA